MSELDELRERVGALEIRVDQEARLRAQVDRDQSDQGAKIAATHHLVQALAITQSQHGEVLREIKESLLRQDEVLLRVVSMLREVLDR